MTSLSPTWLADHLVTKHRLKGPRWIGQRTMGLESVGSDKLTHFIQYYHENGSLPDL